MIAILDAYVDESLAASQRAEIDRHLTLCASCVAYLASYRATIRMARAASVAIEDVPPELITAILATITRNTPSA
ncbi:MAG TPA: zf-HC2 domain-containing protein [Thermoanaerobaculia bacterium]|nr:zf-HC2 domain-containing protein [Thermoanaerobaculia bacterium]